MDEKNEAGLRKEGELFHAMQRAEKPFRQMNAEERRAYGESMTQYGTQIDKSGMFEKLKALFQAEGYCPCAAGDICLVFAGFLNGVNSPGVGVAQGDMDLVALGASLSESTQMLQAIEQNVKIIDMDKLLGAPRDSDDPFADIPKGPMH